MTAPKTRAAGGDAGLLAARNQAPAPAGSMATATRQPEHAFRCESCGHVNIPACRCQCGHLDVFHAFNTANTVRKACSHHETARNTPCPCKAFVPELPEESPHA